MTALLVGTFTVSGVHTLLWFPRALQMRRELRAEEALEEKALEAEALQAEAEKNSGKTDAEAKDGDDAQR